MIREAICEGSDVEEALEKAKAALGIGDTDDYDFEVIQREEKKKFGLFGGRPAKVRAFIEVTVTVAKPAKPAGHTRPKPAVRQTEKKPAAPAAPAPAKDEPVEAAEQPAPKAAVTPEALAASKEKTERFIHEVLDKMGISDITVECTAEGDALDFNLSGEDEGFVIGRRGETLDALQYLASLVANHNITGYIKVSVNVGNYRDKREKTLEILGRKLAFKAIKTGRKQSLEPMNPYERRVIHTAVQKVNGAISWSEGENNLRHVVIGPDPKARNNRRGGYGRRGGKRGGYNKNRNNNHPAPNPDRVPLNEGGAAGLYGRIDK